MSTDKTAEEAVPNDRSDLWGWAREQLRTLDAVIAYMEATPEEAWRTGTVRSEDGTTNCFFGHLFAMGGTDGRGNALWEVFEEEWATTYVVYPVNDGTGTRYLQPTPRQRILAFLHELNTGQVMTTPQSMDEQYAWSLANQAKAAAAAEGPVAFAAA